MSHKKVILIGDKGSCIDIAEEIQDAHDHYGMDIEVIGFAFDDSVYAEGINGWPVLCGTKDVWPRYKDSANVFFVFGMFRCDIVRDHFALRDCNGIPAERYLTFIHPMAYIGRNVRLGSGTIVMANATIKNDVVLGTCNFVNSGVNIGYGCNIGNDNFFATHACLGSSITVGHRNFIGQNSCIRTPSVIGDYNRIGMCANVLNSISHDLMMIGNPAKPILKTLTDTDGEVKLIYILQKELSFEEVLSFFIATKQDFYGFEDYDFLCRYVRKLSDNAKFIICQDTEEHIVGMIAAYVNHPPLCYVSHVCVVNSYKRSGLFQAMSICLDAMATEHFCYRIQLEVRDDNIPAIIAYDRNGFVYQGKARGSSSYMVKNLTYL